MSISTMKNMSRRSLLFAPLGRDVSPGVPLPRLPWADSDAIADNCTGCMDCARACPEKIIVASGSVVTVDFATSGCSFCGDCATACTQNVFWPLENRDQTNGFRAIVTVSDNCLANKSVVCQSCRDFCDEDAILFAAKSGPIPVPTIDDDRCTACGFCVGGCPADALSIIFEPLTVHASNPQVGAEHE